MIRYLSSEFFEVFGIEEDEQLVRAVERHADLVTVNPPRSDAHTLWLDGWLDKYLDALSRGRRAMLEEFPQTPDGRRVPGATVLGWARSHRKQVYAYERRVRDLDQILRDYAAHADESGHPGWAALLLAHWRGVVPASVQGTTRIVDRTTVAAWREEAAREAQPEDCPF